jgi:hypothetical protein
MPARRSRVHQPLAFRGLLVAVALALLASGVGRAQPLALDELQRSALAASVDAAARASDLSSALRDLERAERDPLATPLERLQAAHAVAAARAALTAAELATELATLQRVTAVLEALDAQRAADGSAEVSARQQAADEVRAHAGAITGVDLARSTSSAEAAARSARDAAASLELAWSELALLVALPAPELVAAGLQPLSGDLPALPLLEAFIAEALEGHAGLAAARRGLEVAEIRLAGADHEGTAPNVLSALCADEECAVEPAPRRGRSAPPHRGHRRQRAPPAPRHLPVDEPGLRPPCRRRRRRGHRRDDARGAARPRRGGGARAARASAGRARSRPRGCDPARGAARCVGGVVPDGAGEAGGLAGSASRGQPGASTRVCGCGLLPTSGQVRDAQVGPLHREVLDQERSVAAVRQVLAAEEASAVDQGPR